MNPWAQISGDDNSAPTREHFLRAVRNGKLAFGDQETSDGVESTWAPWEVLPVAEMGALAKYGAKSLVKGAAKALPTAMPQLAEGEIGRAIVSNVSRNPWATPKDLAWGRDITQMAPDKYGILLHQMSAGQPKEAGGMMMGAYLRDKLKTEDPKVILEAVSQMHGIPTPALKAHRDSSVYGTYTPSKNLVKMNPDSFYSGVPDPMAHKLGVVRHEAEHAIDAFKRPEFQSLPEFMGRGSGQVQQEQIAQLLEELAGGPKANDWSSVGRINKSYNKVYDENPWKITSTFPKPDEKSLVTSISPERIAEWEKQIQNAAFNQSRFGDPMHYLEMQSMGHLGGWNSLEAEFAQKMMAQDALNRGLDVHPDIIKKWKLTPKLRIER